jgi:spore maturation protein CgeB
MPEARLIAARPDNWQVTLEQHRPDAVFVESAWRGNEGAWQYRVASYAKNMGDELLQLIVWARDRGVPSIFWNKEDPVHFDRFIDRGGHFDHVFTSDANCIARYRERLGHDRVYSLPFAAQPDLHNPVLSQPRSGSVCFAGTYYGDRHDQRRLDLEHVLKPALAYGLDIYDRRHGMVGRDAANYSFPEIYRPAIRGRLDYNEMVQTYRRYRVFLNVNSVKDSPTMFSRRVFELLACGTPVISSHARGLVELLGDGTVFIVESAADTRRYLDQLLGDEDAWARASLKGMRKVLEEHTYGRRLDEVWERVGLTNGKQSSPPIFTVVARVRSTEGGRCLAEALARQTYRAFDVVVLTDGALPETTLSWWRNRLSMLSVRNVRIESNDAYRQCLDASDSDYLAFLDDRDHYGPNYLRDYALAVRYSGRRFFGKHTFRRRLGADDVALSSAGHSFWHVRSVPSATLVAHKGDISRQVFWGVIRSRVFRRVNDDILSIDHFNYLQDATRSGAGADGAASPKLLESVEV